MEGWAVAPQRRDGGFILHTTSGGDYWQIQSKTNQVGIAIHFADAKSGWVIVRSGDSLITNDGGLTWTRRPSELGNRIRSVKMRSHHEAWGVSPDGQILLTRDQGRGWEHTYVDLAAREKEPVPPTEDLESNQESGDLSPPNTSPRVANTRTALDEDAGEAFRNRRRGRRQRPRGLNPESDAGENVATQRDRRPANRRRPRLGRPRSAQEIVNFHYVNDRDAWAVGKAGHIYHTHDGGVTWERQLGEQLDDFHDVLFLDEDNGWIAGDNGLLLETQDAGQSWTALDIGTRQKIIGVHFASLDPKWGWAMRRDGTVFYTTNGEKWSAGTTPMRPPLFEEDPPRPFVMNDVGFGNFSEGWAVGEDGQIIHNRDGGPIWEPQRTTTGRNLLDVETKFVPLAWAVGSGGTVQRTINGGEYWKLHETNTGYDLHAVSFFTKRKGWATGRYGIVLRTTDGGFKWEAKPSGVTSNLYDIATVSKQDIYAVGAKG